VRQELGLDHIHLLGHSWGGMLAKEYALILLCETQALKAAASSLHSRIEFGYEEEQKVNVASFCFTVL
jgi:pimeloyl-ACP methyl ester carboxylesterase